MPVMAIMIGIQASGKPRFAMTCLKDYTRINLAAQKDDPDSVWSFYRALTALRRSPEYAETLVYGATEPYLPEQKNLMAYFRRGERTLLVLANFQNAPQDAALPGAYRRVVLNNLHTFVCEGNRVHLAPWQLSVLEL